MNSEPDIMQHSQSLTYKITCSFHGIDCLHLPEDGGEGVGDDSDHDQDSEEKDQDSGQDELDILPGNISVHVLLKRSLTAHTCHRVQGVQGVQRALGGKDLFENIDQVTVKIVKY